MIDINKLHIYESWQCVLDSSSTCRLHFEEKNLKYDYLIRPSQSDDLIIFFPAALEREKYQVPYFYRWTYCENLSENVICVSDPTLYLDQKILGGWFIGNKNTWALPEVLKHIENYATNKNIKKIIFCGSSLGGFASIIAAQYFESIYRNKFSVRFIAENPQISLLEYKWINHIKLLAELVFNVDDLAKLPNEMLQRFSIKIFLNSNIFLANGLAIFKESDEHHFNVQQKLLASLSASQINFIIIPTHFDSTGHTPISQPLFHYSLQTLKW